MENSWKNEPKNIYMEYAMTHKKPLQLREKEVLKDLPSDREWQYNQYGHKEYNTLYYYLKKK